MSRPTTETDIAGGDPSLVRGALERDALALRAAGVEPVTPLLHDRVVAAALRLPGALLVTERDDRK